MSRFIKNFIVILVLAITTSVPVMAQAPIREVKTFSVQEAISYYSKLYDTSSTEISRVIFCESSNNPNAKGDGGRAFGVAQFHKPTFDSFSKLMGEKLDYYSYHDQIKLMAWIWKNYPQYKSHWTCSRIVGII